MFRATEGVSSQNFKFFIFFAILLSSTLPLLYVGSRDESESFSGNFICNIIQDAEIVSYSDSEVPLTCPDCNSRSSVDMEARALENGSMVRFGDRDVLVVSKEESNFGVDEDGFFVMTFQFPERISFQNSALKSERSFLRKGNFLGAVAGFYWIADDGDFVFDFPGDASYVDARISGYFNAVYKVNNRKRRISVNGYCLKVRWSKMSRSDDVKMLLFQR